MLKRVSIFLLVLFVVQIQIAHADHYAWTDQTAAGTSQPWQGIATSANGSHLVAANYGSYIYTSSDYNGATDTCSRF